MPKMKTHKGTAKRFKLTATGKVMRRKGFRGHRMRKTPATQRLLATEVELPKGDRRRVKQLLPYA